MVQVPRASDPQDDEVPNQIDGAYRNTCAIFGLLSWGGAYWGFEENRFREKEPGEFAVRTTQGDILEFTGTGADGTIWSKRVVAWETSRGVELSRQWLIVGYPPLFWVFGNQKIAIAKDPRGLVVYSDSAGSAMLLVAPMFVGGNSNSGGRLCKALESAGQ
jgi:hypothetical protein